MIDSFVFGSFVVDGKKFDSNISIINGVARQARYLEGHILVESDFDKLIAARPEIIIIGTGASGVVRVQEEIRQLIESNNIKLIIERTGEACDTCNDLVKDGKKVCAFLHNTC
jgi:hypothetical protein